MFGLPSISRIHVCAFGWACSDAFKMNHIYNKIDEPPPTATGQRDHGVLLPSGEK